MRLLPLLLVVAACRPVAAAAETPRAPQSVVIRMQDGRTLAGEVGDRTNAQTLWLQRASDAVVIQSGFAWERIVAVEVGGQVLTAAQFRAAMPAGAPPPELTLPPAPAPAAAPPTATAVAARRTSPARIRSLDVIADVANWDSDAETDGLRVLVMPRDAQGVVTPVDAQLDCTLIGQDVRSSNVLDLQPPAFPELGRWSVNIRAADFTREGVFVDLPFPRQAPESDLNLTPEGLLSARLGVSGQGAFDAADAFVLLRPFSVIRDQMQFLLRRRTHPSESLPFGPPSPSTRTPNRRTDDRAR